MIFLDGTVVNVALPRLQSDFGASFAGVQWVVNSYLLLLAALLLLGGDLGDRYGRKRVFALGQSVFVLGSVGAGLAPSLGVLLAARVVQGVGGALMVPESLAIIKAVIIPADASRAIGLWAGLSGVATALGPLAGGWLIQALSWRAIFFLNLPLAALALYATLRHIPENRDRRTAGGLDWPGGLATVLGLGGVTYGLIEGPQLGWGTQPVLLALGVGVTALLLFLWREAQARFPMVPLGVFRSVNFSMANLATLGVYFAFTGALLFLTLDLQQVQGYSPLQAGAATLPITLLLLLLSPRVGGWMHRLGARLFMTAGPLVIAAGFVLLMLPGRQASYPTQLLPAIVVVGLGMALFVTPLTATVMAALPDRQAGIASGVNNAVSRLASLLAVAVLGVIVAWRFDATLPGTLDRAHLPSSARLSLLRHRDRLAADQPPPPLSAAQRQAARAAVDVSFVAGFRWDMGACAALCLAVALLSFLTIRRA